MSDLDKTPFEWPAASNILSGAAIITTVSSGVALFVNLLIFSVWGLNFSVIATPSDVFAGGILFLSKSVFLIFLTVSAALFARTLNGYGLFPSVKFHSFVLAANALTATIAATLIVFSLWGGLYILKYDRYLMTAMHGFFSILAFYTFMLRDRRLSRISFVNLIITSLLVVMSTAVHSAQYGQGDLVVVRNSKDNKICNKSDEHLVWAGSSFIISSCSSPPFRRGEEVFVTDRKEIMLKSHKSSHG